MKTTTDLWLTTFLLQNGETLANYTKLGHRKLQFHFNIEDAKWKEYKLQYISSPYSGFEQEMNKLKDLLYG